MREPCVTPSSCGIATESVVETGSCASSQAACDCWLLTTLQAVYAAKPASASTKTSASAVAMVRLRFSSLCWRSSVSRRCVSVAYAVARLCSSTRRTSSVSTLMTRPGATGTGAVTPGVALPASASETSVSPEAVSPSSGSSSSTPAATFTWWRSASTAVSSMASSAGSGSVSVSAGAEPCAASVAALLSAASVSCAASAVPGKESCAGCAPSGWVSCAASEMSGGASLPSAGSGEESCAGCTPSGAVSFWVARSSAALGARSARAGSSGVVGKVVRGSGSFMRRFLRSCNIDSCILPASPAAPPIQALIVCLTTPAGPRRVALWSAEGYLLRPTVLSDRVINRCFVAKAFAASSRRRSVGRDPVTLSVVGRENST